jgi:hypothetical protein
VNVELKSLNLDSAQVRSLLPWLVSAVAALLGCAMPRLMALAATGDYSTIGYALQNAFFAYAAYSMVSTNGLKSWTKAVLIVAAVSAFFALVTLGTHNEGDEDSVAQIVTDFKPTTEERALSFANDAVVMLWGVWVGTVAHSRLANLP